MRWLLKWLDRARLSRKLKYAEPLQWPLVRTVWSEASCLYRGPVGYAASITLEYAALERVACENTISDESLYESLGDAAPYLVGYALEALRKRRSPLVAELPKFVFTRTDLIDEQCGCVGLKGVPLGEFCRHVSANSDAAA